MVDNAGSETVKVRQYDGQLGIFRSGGGGGRERGGGERKPTSPPNLRLHFPRRLNKNLEFCQNLEPNSNQVVFQSHFLVKTHGFRVINILTQAFKSLASNCWYSNKYSIWMEENKNSCATTKDKCSAGFLIKFQIFLFSQITLCTTF